MQSSRFANRSTFKKVSILEMRRAKTRLSDFFHLISLSKKTSWKDVCL
jgi:hypothetical protein